MAGGAVLSILEEKKHSSERSDSYYNPSAESQRCRCIVVLEISSNIDWVSAAPTPALTEIAHLVRDAFQPHFDWDSADSRAQPQRFEAVNYGTGKSIHPDYNYI